MTILREVQKAVQIVKRKERGDDNIRESREWGGKKEKGQERGQGMEQNDYLPQLCIFV